MFGGWRGATRLACLVAVVGGLAGCQVNTQIDVDANPNGTGTVDVTVILDHAAAEAVGDIKSQLQTSDLVTAGWKVTGPTAGRGGSTVLEATQNFTTLTRASTLVAEIAGTGKVDGRPFQLSVVTRKTWWSTHTELVGAADLKCNLACFGDSGLTTQLGTATGVDPGTPASQQKDFNFAVAVRLPGKLATTNASSTSGRTLEWTPKLGERTVLAASTSSRNVTHVVEAVVGAAVLLVLLLSGLAVAIVRRRSRRRRGPQHLSGGR